MNLKPCKHSLCYSKQNQNPRLIITLMSKKHPDGISNFRNILELMSKSRGDFTRLQMPLIEKS